MLRNAGRISIRHFLTRKTLVVCIFLLFFSSRLFGQEEWAETAGRSGFFVDTGLGAGLYLFDDATGSLSGGALHFTVGYDGRLGARIDGNFSVFLMTHVNVTSFTSVVDFTNWVFAENDLRLLLTVFIPFAVFFESQVFIGPGIMYHTSTRAPSLYVEGGLGYSQIQSISQRTFVMGAGLFAGFGVEITPRLGCGLRAIWSPSFLHSGWTPSDNNYFSVMMFIYLM
jgi:hypothetical protein